MELPTSTLIFTKIDFSSPYMEDFIQGGEQPYQIVFFLVLQKTFLSP